MAYWKAHWKRHDGKSLCGQDNVEFSLNTHEVTCLRCKKSMPEARTIWERLIDETPQVKPKPPRKKPPPTPAPLDPVPYDPGPVGAAIAGALTPLLFCVAVAVVLLVIQWISHKF